MALHFYDKPGKLQISCQCRAQIQHRDTITQRQWERSQALARACYQPVRCPSDPYENETDQVTIEEAYAHFAVVVCQVLEVDVLWLSIEENQRYHLNFTNNQISRIKFCSSRLSALRSALRT